MRHLHSGRKLGVAPHHRKALLRNLTLALIERETIRTTPARAKELRWFADRVVTLAKRGDIAGRRQIIQLLGSTRTQHAGENRVRNAIERVYSQLAPRFKDRNGGFTQILRLADRRPGDNAEMCVMRYLPAPEEKKGAKKADPAKKSAKAETKDKAAKKLDAKASEAATPKASKVEDKKPSDKPAKKKQDKEE